MKEWWRLWVKARDGSDEDWRRLQRHMQHYRIGGYDEWGSISVIVRLMWSAPLWLAEWAQIESPLRPADTERLKGLSIYVPDTWAYLLVCHDTLGLIPVRMGCCGVRRCGVHSPDLPLLLCRTGVGQARTMKQRNKCKTYVPLRAAPLRILLSSDVQSCVCVLGADLDVRLVP